MSIISNKEEMDMEVRKIIQETAEVDISHLDSEANLFQKAGIDSMRALEVMAAVEQKFKIRIQEQDLPKMTNVRSICELVSRCLSK